MIKITNFLLRIKCFYKILAFKINFTGFNKEAFETAWAISRSSFVRVKAITHVCKNTDI